MGRRGEVTNCSCCSRELDLDCVVKLALFNMETTRMSRLEVVELNQNK